MQQCYKKKSNHKASYNSPQGQSSSTTLVSLAEKVEEAFEKRFYIYL